MTKLISIKKSSKQQSNKVFLIEQNTLKNFFSCILYLKKYTYNNRLQFFTIPNIIKRKYTDKGYFTYFLNIIMQKKLICIN